MRIIQIIEPKTLELLEQKNASAIENQNIIAEMEKLNKTFESNMAKVARIDEKARVKLKKLVPTLGEYEQVSRVYVDNDDWYFEIADRMEEFKIHFKK